MDDEQAHALKVKIVQDDIRRCKIMIDGLTLKLATLEQELGALQDA